MCCILGLNVLLREVVVDAHPATLQDAPHALNLVRGSHAIHELLHRMTNDFVIGKWNAIV